MVVLRHVRRLLGTSRGEVHGNHRRQRNADVQSPPEEPPPVAGGAEWRVGHLRGWHFGIVGHCRSPAVGTPPPTSAAVALASNSSRPTSISRSAHAFPSAASSANNSWRKALTVIRLSRSVMKSTLPTR